MGWQDLVKEDKQFDEIPKGKYLAILDEVGTFETKEPKSIMLKYKIVDGDFKNRVLSHFHRWTDQSHEFIAKDLMKLEADDCELEFEAVANAFTGVIGKPAEIYVKPREYNGKTYYNVYVNGVKDSEGLFGVDSNDDF